jgi:predicted amidohydrolase YtcJ
MARSGINRLTRSNKVIGPDQRVSAYEAMKALTTYAAYQNFEEDIKGAISLGKLADLVILSEDPLKIDPMKIKDIKVLETIKEGKTVYRIGK